MARRSTTAERARNWETIRGNATIAITWPRQCNARVEAIVPAILLIADFVVAIPQ